jgi:hypothetical protein
VRPGLQLAKEVRFGTAKVMAPDAEGARGIAEELGDLLGGEPFL